MSPDHIQKLLKVAPTFYRGLDLHSKGAFEIGDGWFEIVYEASRQIEEMIFLFSESIHLETIDSHSPFIQERVPYSFGPRCIRGVLEMGFLKLGYVNSRFFEVVDEARERSSKVCMYCGTPGKHRKEGLAWERTVCDDHYHIELCHQNGLHEGEIDMSVPRKNWDEVNREDWGIVTCLDWPRFWAANEEEIRHQVAELTKPGVNGLLYKIFMAEISQAIRDYGLDLHWAFYLDSHNIYMEQSSEEVSEEVSEETPSND